MASAEQEDSQLDSRAGSGGKRDIVKWTERMEEAYEAALKQLGGLDNAKPKAVYDLLAHEFPVLSVQNVKWHIQTHRKREEMRKHKPADYQGPTRWVGRLEEAYEAEVARQGGLHSARPKALLEALQPEFPELTLQIIKWHLQLQRRKDQQQRQARQSQQGPAQSDTAAMQGGSAPAQAPGRHALAASGPAMRAAPSTLAHGEVQQGASAMSSGSADGPGMPATSMPPLSAAAAAAAARVAHARQAPGSTPSPAASTGRQASLPVSQQPSLMTSQAYRSQQGWGAASLPPAPQQLGCPQASQQAQQQQQRGEQPQQAHVLLEHILQGHGPPSLQPQQPGTPSGSLSGQATSQAGSLLHSAAAGLQAGLPGGLNPQLQVLREQQLEQQRRLELAHRQQQQQLLTQLLQAQQRTAPPPWTPFLLPAAQAALEEATATRDRCLHIVGSLRQRAAELSELLQVLAAAGTVGSGPTGAGCQSDLEALLPLAEGLLPATLLHGAGAGATYASRGGGRGWAAMAAAGGPATRRQRTLASLAASFPTVRDDAAAASWASGI